MLSWFRRSKQASSTRNAASPEPAVTASAVGVALRKKGNALLAQGQLAEAEETFRRATSIDPKSIDSWVNLGFVLSERGSFPPALSALERAAALDPSHADAQYLLGKVRMALADVAAATEHFIRALEIAPGLEPCRRDLCLAYASRGDFDAARKVAEQGLAITPSSSDLHHILGNLHAHVGDLAAAILSFRAAIALNPQAAQTHAWLGNALNAQGQWPEAVASYRRAIELQPAFIEAQRSLAILLQQQGETANAVQIYRAVLEAAPDDVDVICNLGVALTSLHRLSEAQAVLAEAIQRNPQHVAAHVNMGLLRSRQSDLTGARQSLELAIKLDPLHAVAHSNLGAILQKLGHLAGARSHCERAIAHDPTYAAGHSNLGLVHQDSGGHDLAAQHFRQALTLAPSHTAAWDNLLFTLNYHPDLTAAEVFAAYREYDAQMGLPRLNTEQQHTNPRNSTRRLRVGYVSPDFRKHAVRHFLEPLLANHDKRSVDVFAYAELSEEDFITTRYRRHVDHWVPTAGLSDESLAQRIRDDGIDILVDLAGHTADNRLGTFARKPAPVSLSWLGFGYTTGLSAIDYLLTDETCAPEGSDAFFSERPWQLETPGFAYRPAEDMGDVNVLPALERGFVTFGTLTRAVRINHRTIKAWSRVLHRVPNSRLTVDSNNYCDPPMRSALLARFAAHGIGPERLQIGFHTPPWDTLRGIDIALDCFPHNSGTTLFESLYMGLPYVTLAGRPSVGRLGSSILIGAGHPEWIAYTEEEYVDKCVALASDLRALAALRAGLRDQMRASPLMDEVGFTRKVEAAYREMFARWAAG
jgi:protein O-GlcNAc transferase